MKRNAALVLAFLVTGSFAFAGGSVDVYGGLPLANQNMELNGVKFNAGITSVSGGLNFGTYFTPGSG
jgi:hypothetical protein